MRSVAWGVALLWGGEVATTILNFSPAWNGRTGQDVAIHRLSPREAKAGLSDGMQSTQCRPANSGLNTTTDLIEVGKVATGQ